MVRGRYGDLTKQYEAPSPECYIFWMMTMYSENLIDQTLQQFLTVTGLDLITEFDFLPNCARFP